MSAMTRPTANRTANTLGWISIGLGVSELVGAGRLLGMVGGRRTGVARLFGLREIATGVGLLVAKDPTPFVWGRAGGDVLDAAGLLAGIGQGRRSGRNRLAALLVVGLIGVLDVLSARSMRARR